MELPNNPAYERLLASDRDYHLVFLVIGGPCLVLLLLLAVWSWVRYRRATRRTFERRTFLGFGVVSLFFGLFMVVAFWANLTSVLDPGRTIAGTTYTPTAEAWLRSGRAELSPALQQAIDDRLAWQQPKAVICAGLLVVFVALTALLWRRLLRRPPARSLGRRLTVGAAVLSAAACLLLMLMVIGNAESAAAPLFPTVQMG
jgi:hypothetical protein